ncbi:DUF2235 domain-containing protein [Methylocystis parvus]|uniref:DUF2235 domain-containing protein n=1 Tax=Methylocystis parvus TaxID=134 RepID=A0A6B8MGS9_9HYPH|nr:DUF2235 domain-containing protein [Methylocystis parvus]QGM99880.1 DUF2235 domain-containing protein [Methylocystis parvus]WBK02303.1 DUF2235 domain-containing protein [Methylocystis parvus OBBP]
MPKNIVILLDGTSNEISADRTNILRLYGTLEKGDRQLVYYDPGVGTFGAENAWLRFWRKAVEIWGLATGWGLDHNVKEAYRFLVENYDDGRRGGGGQSSRDSIYIFGFSRGAYTARVLAGFIHAVGLIEKRNLNLLDYAYSAYKGIGENGEDKFGEVRLYERILAPDRPPIRLLGLFDTVASVIEHGRYGPRLRSHAHTKRNWSVESVRHAVAIDERRTMFRPQLWPEGEEYWGNPFNKAAAKPQDVREVWFAGVHGDVGGGYPEAESGLAKVALQWMVEQTGPLGLFYRTQTVNELVLGRNPDQQYISPDPHAKPHNSMSWGWGVLEFLPQRRRKLEDGSKGSKLTIPLFARRSIPAGARIHQSVTDRANGGDRPPNMPADFLIE